MGTETSRTERQALTRINAVLADCPTGVPMSSTWLESKGVYPQLLQKYKESGWLEPLGRGIWIRAGTRPTLAGAVFALQRIGINAYPAARSALELQGRSHYVPTGEVPVLHMSLGAGQRMPQWFRAMDFARNLHLLNASTLFEPVSAGLSEVRSEGVEIKLSSPERAMVEYCQLLPKHADFEEARQLMEGLPTLRPRLVQSTLQACKSVKAKRLFLALASVVGHSWFSELDQAQFDLGASNRILPIEGVPHPVYNITVPEAWIVE
tara:strand:- start:12781 stop:13575 length:795 start_codon:yes stop_codon:yes gene_type:complete